MAGQIRPNSKLMKIAYTLLQTPSTMRQKNDKVPNEKRIAAWKINSSISAQR